MNELSVDSPQGRLALEDGTIVSGRPFGATGRGIVQTAEVVFNTAMCGYQEAITDPSYWGQLLVFTAPQIGNTGVNREDVESVRVQAAGMIVRELSRLHSSFRADMDLSAYLAQSGVLGLSGVDTRALTRRLRVGGVMRGAITDVSRDELSDEMLISAAKNAPRMDGQNLVPLVGCSSPQRWAETLGDWSAPAVRAGKPLRVLAIDCGAKRNILRHLADRECLVDVVPHDLPAAEIRSRLDKGEADGLFISNGPGDPAAVDATIASLRAIIGPGAVTTPTLPIFGICLGHQLLSLALGAKTFKLKFGHRGVNHPVLNLLSGRVEITSQNHGFAVDPETLKQVGAQATHVNLNDGTLAGFAMNDKPVFAVQHHPEASPGPHDSAYLFDTFVTLMLANRSGRSVGALEALTRRIQGTSPATSSVHAGTR